MDKDIKKLFVYMIMQVIYIYQFFRACLHEDATKGSKQFVIPKPFHE